MVAAAAGLSLAAFIKRATPSAADNEDANASDSASTSSCNNISVLHQTKPPAAPALERHLDEMS